MAEPWNVDSIPRGTPLAPQRGRATELSKGLNAYLSRGIHRINGWCSVFDGRIFAELLGLQNQHAFSGSLVEIGVHHGRSFFVLVLAALPTDQLLAIDLFEDDAINANTPNAERSRQFMEHCRKLDLDMSRIRIHKGSSLDLTHQLILGQVGPCRFFSIDGGHMYEDVHHDILLAQKTITDYGIIAIDDFCNRAWPEVTFATHDALNALEGRLEPFALTPSKLYCTAPRYAEIYRCHLQKSFANNVRRTITISGHKTLTLELSIASRIIEALRDRLTGYGSVRKVEVGP